MFLAPERDVENQKKVILCEQHDRSGWCIICTAYWRPGIVYYQKMQSVTMNTGMCMHTCHTDD